MSRDIKKQPLMERRSVDGGGVVDAGDDDDDGGKVSTPPPSTPREEAGRRRRRFVIPEPFLTIDLLLRRAFDGVYAFIEERELLQLKNYSTEILAHGWAVSHAEVRKEGSTLFRDGNSVWIRETVAAPSSSVDKAKEGTREVVYSLSLYPNGSEEQVTVILPPHVAAKNPEFLAVAYSSSDGGGGRTPRDWVASAAHDGVASCAESCAVVIPFSADKHSFVVLHQPFGMAMGAPPYGVMQGRFTFTTTAALSHGKERIVACKVLYDAKNEPALLCMHTVSRQMIAADISTAALQHDLAIAAARKRGAGHLLGRQSIATAQRGRASTTFPRHAASSQDSLEDGSGQKPLYLATLHCVDDAGFFQEVAFSPGKMSFLCVELGRSRILSLPWDPRNASSSSSEGHPHQNRPRAKVRTLLLAGIVSCACSDISTLVCGLSNGNILFMDLLSKGRRPTILALSKHRLTCACFLTPSRIAVCDASGKCFQLEGQKRRGHSSGFSWDKSGIIHLDTGCLPLRDPETGTITGEQSFQGIAAISCCKLCDEQVCWLLEGGEFLRINVCQVSAACVGSREGCSGTVRNVPTLIHCPPCLPNNARAGRDDSKDQWASVACARKGVVQLASRAGKVTAELHLPTVDVSVLRS